MEEYEVLEELGRGTFGVVYKVMKNNEVFVMKKINLSHMKSRNQKEALKEASILKRVEHPNIIKYYTSFMDNQNLCIVMEYAEGGDLYQLVKNQREKKKYLPEKQIWQIGWELCKAVWYLHSHNIIHRDIKCLNIFLTKDKHIKLGDLGVSKIVQSTHHMNATRVGTPLYLSPELVKQQPYDVKVDIWAIGCVLYHLTCLEAPFRGENLIALGNAIVNKKPKIISTCFSFKLQALIMKCLEKKAADRPTIEELLSIFPQNNEESQQIINDSSMTSTKDTFQNNFKENFRKSTTLVPVISSSRDKSSLNEIPAFEQPKQTNQIESESGNIQIKEIKIEQQKTRPMSAAIREFAPISSAQLVQEEVKTKASEKKLIRPSTAKQQPQCLQINSNFQILKPNPRNQMPVMKTYSRPASAYP